MNPDAKSIISIKGVSKSFKLPHEQSNGLKQLIVNVFNRKKGYEIQKVLKNISFDIREGEFFGVVGRNGSGKSTLLKILAGIYTPNKGEVSIRGSLTPFIELGVGFNPELTGKENVFLNGAMLGFNRKEITQMYNDIVSFAELEKFMDQKLKNYSSGMQVRLAFSIAIRANSDILVLDEVLAVGDTAFQQKCFTYFEQLKSEKRTIILVTHDMSSVMRFCTRAIYIEKGKIIADGTPEDVSDIYKLRNIEAGEDKSRTEEHIPGLDHSYKITNKLKSQTPEEIDVNFSINSETNEKMYVGISLFKDGICIAEMNSMSSAVLTKTGNVDLSISTAILNPGVYELTSALFMHDQRRLIAIPKNRISFTIKGNDNTRDGAIKLADTWKKV
ncbi:MAG: transporter ATP-binding protein [Candidatus Saccharibacteria bacterium]|nr:transporter ATP-binding protein [Candidatus Saccharibacteria bacterium]